VDSRATSQVTSDYQTTIPTVVRTALGLEQGDALVYEIATDGTVTLRKALALDTEWPQTLEATLCEWNTDDDREVYRVL
jgi:bifunctional DNA-binding transcriptional regulator/antitoxin component of YhaV-PrlF toxin-antitoxin module